MTNRSVSQTKQKTEVPLRANYLGSCTEMTTSHPSAVEFEVDVKSNSQGLSSISSPIHLDLPNSCLENQLCSENKDENLCLSFHLSVLRSRHLHNMQLIHQ